MLRGYLFGALLVAATTSVTPASAGGFYNGNELLASCRELDGDDILMCYGYLAGAADSNRTALSLITYCLPGGVSVRQVRDVVVQYLEANPQERHYGASTLISFALSRSFPCKAPPPKG